MSDLTDLPAAHTGEPLPACDPTEQAKLQVLVPDGTSFQRKVWEAPPGFADASRFLAAQDPDWAQHIEVVGPCRHQPHPQREPYEALVRAVAYQQLHARAGDAILARLMALYPGGRFPTPAELLITEPERLRACGFSARKLQTLLGIAQATLDGQVPGREVAMALDDDALMARLMPLRGVGRWTVEMFLIYTLERRDILPADDFGVREGYRRLKGLEETPSAALMRQLGQAWSPWRTVAAWYLWRMPPTHEFDRKNRSFRPRQLC